MVKILIAPDKFKGSLSATEVCQVIEQALVHNKSDLQITTVPLADGGEGTRDVLNSIFKSDIITATVSGPLFDPITVNYTISKDKSTGIIEMASASGLQLLTQQQRNPRYTTTFGTGQLIADALDRGVNKVILGIGGSATNDAGIGMAAALGFQFLDASGNLLKPTGDNLIRIATIKSDKVHQRLKEVEFTVLCDVDNPLHGPQGAAFIYGPQKGASDPEIKMLDDGLKHFEKVIYEIFKVGINFPGAGAAGGMGAGAKFFLTANLIKGIDYIIDVTALKASINDADLVITGEGKIDKQSLSGKVVVEVSRLARNFNKPVVAICGQCDLSAEELRQTGISQCISLVDNATPREEAIRHARDLIKKRIADHFIW